jgi:membrane protein required for colicin V production
MGELSVTIVDLVVGAVILLSALLAAWRGLMRETLSIFSWAVAAYVTLRFFPTARPMLRDVVSPEWLADLLVFIGVFVVVLVLLSVIAFRISDAVKRTEIGPVDRALGFVFGVGRGLVVIGLAYIAFSLLVPPQAQPAWLVQARLFPLVENTSDVLLSLVPAPEDIPLNLEELPQLQAPSSFGLQVPIVAPAGTPENSGSLPVDAANETYGADERAALDSLIEATGSP